MTDAQKLERMTNVTTYKDADAIPADWVEALDVEQAFENAERFHKGTPPNKSDRRPEFEMPEPGTWIATRIGRYVEFAVAVWIPVNEMRAGEGDWEFALQYESTRKYIEWAEQGHHPPPLFVVTNDGGLSSLNRRRWLAAREAGTEKLLCWYSPTAEGSTFPKWYIEREREV